MARLRTRMLLGQVVAIGLFRVAVGLGAACLTTLASAEGRVALVIGNADYANISPLTNPVNDADDVSFALKSLDFGVFTGKNLTRAETLALIAEFADAAATSDAALFYFAGHAFQIGGRNYLVPEDLRPDAPERILEQSISLDLVTNALERAPGLRLIFLDACRDNPLGLSQAAGDEGLARVGSAANFLIVYATQPGAVAFDGEGRNGTFTEAVLNHIHTPGQSIGEMMISVRKDVISATGGHQIPWENSSLTREFKFDTGRRTASDDTMLYQIAARSQNSDLMRLYTDRFPRGSHIVDASAFLEADATDSGSAPEAGGRSMAEYDDDLWSLTQRTRMRRLAELYLKYLPDGSYVSDAQDMIDTLPSYSDLGPGRLCELRATHPRDSTAELAGTDFEVLRTNSAEAIAVCSEAVKTFPEQAHYVALLARAKIASGQRAEAVALYEQAAALGDLRALVSLGLLTELGNGVPKDPQRAVALYERAADGNSADGAINLAVALYQGTIVEKDVSRAIALLRRASAAGSAIATFNLGVLAQEGTAGDGRDALSLFRKAALDGEPRGYRAAAVLLDEGRGVAMDPADAASLLLRGAAEDSGQVIAEFAGGRNTWTPETIRAMQSRLKRAGFYVGAIDGIAGPQLINALRKWRAGGFDPAVVES